MRRIYLRNLFSCTLGIRGQGRDRSLPWRESYLFGLCLEHPGWSQTIAISEGSTNSKKKVKHVCQRPLMFSHL